MRGILADKRGFAFSLDILLALIPLTILMGILVADMDNIMYLTQSTIYQSSLDRQASDIADALVETPGVPPDWEQRANPQSIGLAKYDPVRNTPQKNYLSPAKIAGMNTTNMGELVGPEYGYYINISTTEGLTVRTLGSLNTSAPDIARVERFVLTTKVERVGSIEGLIRDAGQPRTYTTNFPTNDAYLRIYDYWVLVVNRGYDSAFVDVNNNRVVPPNEINRHITEIKKQINETYLYNNTTFRDNILSVRTQSNPGASMDVYILAAPKGTPADQITLDNVRLRPAKFVLYLWMK
ncbi:hypothetical protein [Methanothermobacter marburgensis]|uniref:hypothetical protein n=1 Tax=Methanothermobacter marburgensis TaxID=145263 RepID=UPI0035B7A5CB